MTSYFGKYRGTVTNNIDPQNRGRLLVEVPDVLGLTPSSWAEACAPLSGPTGTGMGAYFVPPIGAAVWVEFEQGEPEKPIWVGCRFDSSSDVPAAAKDGLPVSPSIVLQTALKNSFSICDGPDPGFTLKTALGAKIEVTATHVLITNGIAKIELLANAVKINDTALVVM